MPSEETEAEYERMKQAIELGPEGRANRRREKESEERKTRRKGSPNKSAGCPTPERIRELGFGHLLEHDPLEEPLG